VDPRGHLAIQVRLRIEIQSRRYHQIADRNDAKGQNVIVVEQAAIEPGDCCLPEAAVLVCHGVEQLAQHWDEIVGTLYRLVEDVGENASGKSSTSSAKRQKTSLLMKCATRRSS
jgi:hypothetical protein